MDCAVARSWACAGRPSTSWGTQLQLTTQLSSFARRARPRLSRRIGQRMHPVVAPFLTAKKRGVHEGNPRMAGAQQLLYDSQHLCAPGYSGKKHFCRKNDQGIQHLSRNPGYHIGGENSGENWPKAKKKPGSSKPRNPVIPSVMC